MVGLNRWLDVRYRDGMGPGPRPRLLRRDWSSADDHALEDTESLKGDLVEKPERGESLVVDAPGDLLFMDEVEEVGADVVGPEGLRRASELACECGDPHGIPGWRRRGRVAGTGVVPTR